MTEDQKLERIVHFAMNAYELKDAELAFVMLDVTRAAAKQVNYDTLPEDIHSEVEYYFSSLLPEVAKRLCEHDGVRVALPKVRELASLSDEGLRIYFADFISSDLYRKVSSHLASLSRDQHLVRAIDIATATIANGNIFAIALDRLCKGELTDKIARIVSVTSAIRNTPSQDGRWVPEISMSLVGSMPVAADRTEIMKDIIVDILAGYQPRQDDEDLVASA